MGAACCVAAKDKTIVHGPPNESLQRHARHSPSWSFRWDNRGRVAGEETSENWVRDRGGRNDRIEAKSSTTTENAFASEEGSPLDSFRSLALQKYPVSERNAGLSRLPSSDQTISENPVEVKESTETPSVSHSSPIKLSVSSIPSSPLSSQSSLLPPNSTPSRWHHRSPGHRLLHQVSDTRVPEYKSPTFSISEETSSFVPPAWANDSTRGSIGGSSDSWSIPGFSELMSTRRERWSFDSEASGFSREKVSKSSGRNSRSLSIDLQTCGVCTKILTDKSSLGSNNQSISSANEVAVVSVLICGHVYHAECLEYMTPEVNKYDPTCPVCTLGEKRISKMCEKVLKGELDSKARKRWRKRVADSDVNSEITFGHNKSCGTSPKMSTSSSMKSSSTKPFLKRHFSFGSKPSRSISENQSSRRKSFFWARSSKD